MHGIKCRLFQTALLWSFVVLVWLMVPFDPLYGTIGDDPSYGADGIFYIYDTKDYLRFIGYMNRARLEDRENTAAVSTDVSLMADIDLSENGYSGLKKHPYIKQCILYYDGCFDGNGHKILWKKNAGNGMFVQLGRNAVLQNLDFTADSLVWEMDEYGVGMLCMINYGQIRNCRTSGSVEGTACYTGGIAGINHGTIESCVNRAQVTSGGLGDYGAGGIAGKNAQVQTGEEAELGGAVQAEITDCTNFGTVLGEWIAGGICAVTQDTVICRCGNEAAVSVQRQQVPPFSFDEDWPDEWVDANAGGIAGIRYSGMISQCYNRGTVSIIEEGPNGTYGIAGGGPGHFRVLDCVSLTGVAQGHMRHENIMELSPEEMERWRADQAAVPYVYNSWQFDLEEAREKLGLEPLGVSQSAVTKEREEVYLCEDFLLCAPEGFAVKEVSPYALCMEAKEGTDLPEPGYTDAAGYQVWVLRLPEDKLSEMNGFLRGTETLRSVYAPASWFNGKDSLTGALWLSTLDAEKVEKDISHIWDDTGEGPDFNWLHPLDFSNYWDHHTWFQGGKVSLNLYKEELNAKYYVYASEEDAEGPRLDNIISLPVKNTEEKGNEVKYLLLFTNKENNYRPDLEFAKEVLAGFTYLPVQIRVMRGDTLSSLAYRYAGDGNRYAELQEYNGLEDADVILAGQTLSLPESWLVK